MAQYSSGEIPHDPIVEPMDDYHVQPSEGPRHVTIDRTTWNQALEYTAGAGNITTDELINKFNLTPTQAAAALERLRVSGMAYEREIPSYPLPIPPESSREHPGFRNGELRERGLKPYFIRKIGSPLVKQTVEYAHFKVDDVSRLKNKFTHHKQSESSQPQNTAPSQPAPQPNWDLEIIDNHGQAYETYTEQFSRERNRHSSRTSRHKEEHDDSSTSSSEQKTTVGKRGTRPPRGEDMPTPIDRLAAAHKFALEHIKGDYRTDRPGEVLPRLSIESLAGLFKKSESAYTPEETTETYQWLQDQGVIVPEQYTNYAGEQATRLVIGMDTERLDQLLEGMSEIIATTNNKDSARPK